MRILITGNEGFVGSHIQTALESEHEIVGLEAKGSFKEWYDEMNMVMDTPIDAVVHTGAISNNQTDNPDIYLWNSYATYLLAQQVRSMETPIPFILFSTLLVEETENQWEHRSPYTWSKVQAEHFTQFCLPHATILRFCVIWGDEREKHGSSGSVPFQLADHSLKHLFRKWTRRYVHVSDVVEAVKNCLKYHPKGVYSVSSLVFWTNKQLSELTDWNGYEWIDDPRDVGFKHILDHDEPLHAPRLPRWIPKIDVQTELPQLERRLNYGR